MPTSVWRGYITFGLVTIPVKLHRAARPERVKLREIYEIPVELPPEPEGSTRIEPVGHRTSTEPETIADDLEPSITFAPTRRMSADHSGDALPPATIHKGYEFEKGRFVRLGAEEIRALVPKTSTEMELIEFVELVSIDPIYFETSYYVQPEPAGEKPYALLYESLRQTRLAGVTRLAMHRREHIVIVRTGTKGLIAHTMFLTSEVRSQQEYQANSALTKS